MAINSDPHIHELVVCANIFVRKDGKYLLMKRSPLKKFAPNVVHPYGGKVDRSENPYLAAKREIFEEAGIQVNNLRLEAVIMEVFERSNSNNWLIFHFSADYESGKVLQTEEGETVLLTENEIKQQELFPSVRKLINAILNPEDGTVFATFVYDESGNSIVEEKIDLCVK